MKADFWMSTYGDFCCGAVSSSKGNDRDFSFV